MESKIITEDEEMHGPVMIQKLEEQGINNGDIKKFTEAGFYSV